MSDFEYGLAEKNRYAEAKLAIDSLRGSGLDATQVIAKSKKSISEKVEQQQRTLDALALDTNCDSAVGQKTAALQIKSSAGDADTELRNAMDATIDFADPLYSNLEDQSCDWLWEDQAYLAAEARCVLPALAAVYAPAPDAAASGDAPVLGVASWLLYDHCDGRLQIPSCSSIQQLCNRRSNPCNCFDSNRSSRSTRAE